jgi:phosphonate transport system substrate-binding protein
MVNEKKIDPAQVKVFYTTPPYFDYIWVARKGLDPKLSDAFSQALLKLDPNNPEHKPFLDLLVAAKYVKADDGDYDKLRQAAKDAGLMK